MMFMEKKPKNHKYLTNGFFETQSMVG